MLFQMEGRKFSDFIQRRRTWYTVCLFYSLHAINREILTFLSIYKNNKQIQQFKKENFQDTIFLTFRSTILFQINRLIHDS